MNIDFTPYLMADEQIMWQGQSHKQGAPADRETKTGRFMGILWTIISLGLFSSVLYYTADDPQMDATARTAIIIMGIIFVGVGIGVTISNFYIPIEYYCITDKRFLLMNKKGDMKGTGELSRVRRAEISGIRNNLGTIVMYTNIKHYHHTAHNHAHHHHSTTTTEKWKIIAVENPSECYRILTSILLLNEQTL